MDWLIFCTWCEQSTSPWQERVGTRVDRAQMAVLGAGTALMANTGDEANAAGRTDSMHIVHCTVDAGSDDTLLDGYLSSATMQKKKQRPIFQILVIHKCFALTTWSRLHVTMMWRCGHVWPIHCAAGREKRKCKKKQVLQKWTPGSRKKKNFQFAQMVANLIYKC